MGNEITNNHYTPTEEEPVSEYRVSMFECMDKDPRIESWSLYRFKAGVISYSLYLHRVKSDTCRECGNSKDGWPRAFLGDGKTLEEAYSNAYEKLQEFFDSVEEKPHAHV